MLVITSVPDGAVAVPVLVIHRPTHRLTPRNLPALDDEPEVVCEPLEVPDVAVEHDEVGPASRRDPADVGKLEQVGGRAGRSMKRVVEQPP